MKIKVGTRGSGLALAQTNSVVEKIRKVVPEMIVESENGIIVPVDNGKEMAEEIEKLINDENLRKKLGKNAQNIIKTQNVDAIMKKWEKVIKEIKNG